MHSVASNAVSFHSDFKDDLRLESEKPEECDHLKHEDFYWLLKKSSLITLYLCWFDAVKPVFIAFCLESLGPKNVTEFFPQAKKSKNLKTFFVQKKRETVVGGAHNVLFSILFASFATLSSSGRKTSDTDRQKWVRRVISRKIWMQVQIRKRNIFSN